MRPISGINVCGIKPDTVVSENREANPSGQSWLIHANDKALLIRPSSSEFSTELERRVEATQNLESIIPEYVQPTRFIVVQGIIERDGQQELLPLMARIVPWLDNVTAVNNLPLTQILTDPELCQALRKINGMAISQLVNHSRVYDMQLTIKQLLESKFQIHEAINSLLSTNLMVGINPETGERVLFMDPDWYENLKELPTRIRLMQLGDTTLWLAGFTLFGGMEMVNKARELLKKMMRRQQEPSSQANSTARN